MNTVQIAHIIIDLQTKDLQLRDQLIAEGKLSNGYDQAMEKLHQKNAKILAEIVDTIGYPTVEKVGKEASEAAWLVIQHSIGWPDFMKKCRELLKMAVNENKADPISLAYLTDRIAVLAGEPQRYGTQFDWNENAELSPNFFDDLAEVNRRRNSIGLNTLEEQTLLMKDRVKSENQTPPKDIYKRKYEMDEWRKKVGWIK